MTEDELMQAIERAAKEDLQSLDLSNNELSSLPPENRKAHKPSVARPKFQPAEQAAAGNCQTHKPSVAQRQVQPAEQPAAGNRQAPAAEDH